MALPSPNVCELIRAHFILLGSLSWKEEERDRPLKLLAEHGLKWGDLPEVLLATANLGATTPPGLLLRHHFGWGDMPKVFADASAPQSPKKLQPFRRLAQCFGLFGQENANAAANTRKQLDAFLARHGLTWADLTAILAASATPPPSDPRVGAPHPYSKPEYTPAGLVEGLVGSYVTMSEPVSVISSLWTCFTHVYTRFAIAPRLAVVSEEPQSGKSTLGKATKRLVYRPNRTVLSTGAAIQRFLGLGHGTVMTDEMDHLEAEARRALQRIWNLGYDREASEISLVIGGKEAFFNLYAPMFSAGIRGFLAGMTTFLAPTQQSRSFALEMERFTEQTKPKYEYNVELSPENPESEKLIRVFDQVYSFLCGWAANVKLNPKPSIPPELIARYGDNARGLVSIADSCNPEWGHRIRDALMFFFEKEKQERPQVTIVRHGIAIFDAFGLPQRSDVIPTVEFDKQLKRLDLPDARWTRYRGPSGLEYAHPITIAERAALLRKAKPPVVSKTCWPPGPRTPGGTFNGYVRGQFEDALQGYEQEGRVKPERGHLRLITPTSDG